MTMLPRVKGISYGLTKLPTHNYIISIASLVHCCVGLFADSPPSQYFDTNSIFSIILWGYPFYIYMCMCVLRVPLRQFSDISLNLRFKVPFCQFFDTLCQFFDIFYVNSLTTFDILSISWHILCQFSDSSWVCDAYAGRMSATQVHVM